MKNYSNYKADLLALPDGKRVVIRYSTLEDRYKQIHRETNAYYAKQKMISEFKSKQR